MTDKYIYINIYLPKRGFTPAGVVIFNEENHYGGFSYFKEYMQEGLPPLNPATLNYKMTKSGEFLAADSYHLMDRVFWEMIPEQNDWGNQVIIARYPEYAYLGNAEKLYFLGKRTVGGLQSYVHDKAEEFSIDSIDWLDNTRQESIDFFQKNIERMGNLRATTALTSYGGLRPKCMFKDDDGSFWLAKFNLPGDAYNMAKVEHMGLLMSRDMGLNTAESKVLVMPSGQEVFLSKRFDRDGVDRLHSISFFALAADIKKAVSFIPGQPASAVQALTRKYSNFANSDTELIVAKFLLDIAVNNTDNHLKNLRLILNRQMKWEVAPIYDIVMNFHNQPYVYNPTNTHLEDVYLDNPNLAKLLSKELHISEESISRKILKTQSVSEQWEQYADDVGLEPMDKEKVANAISIGKNRQSSSYKAKRSVVLVPKPKYK